MTNYDSPYWVCKIKGDQKYLAANLKYSTEKKAKENAENTHHETPPLTLPPCPSAHSPSKCTHDAPLAASNANLNAIPSPWSLPLSTLMTNALWSVSSIDTVMYATLPWPVIVEPLLNP
jgi:hypothetical protein